MANIFSRLFGGKSLGGGLTGVGPSGPEIPFGGREAANASTAIDPRLFSALGFLGGQLSSQGQQAPTPDLLNLLQQGGGGGLPTQLTGSAGLNAAQVGGASNFGILQLLGALGR